MNIEKRSMKMLDRNLVFGGPMHGRLDDFEI